jgi:hypothetical protein
MMAPADRTRDRSGRQSAPFIDRVLSAVAARDSTGLHPRADGSSGSRPTGAVCDAAEAGNALTAVAAELAAGERPARRVVKPCRTGVRFDPLLPINRWKLLGATIATHSQAASWWLGDWLLFGQAKYGRRYREGIALTGLDYQTLRNYAVVARRFELSRRRDNLTFQHHAELCALSDDDQDRWLDLAAQGHWSKMELRRRVRAARARATPARTTTVRLVIEPQRDLRWRQAATRSGCALTAWMTSMLDAAAAAVLGEDPATSDGDVETFAG